MVVLPNTRRKYMVDRIPLGATVAMSECVVTLASGSKPYTGAAQTVGVTVTWNGVTLAVNENYTVSYANNVNVGPATVTVTGMGQFTGSVTKTYYIVSGSSIPTDWGGIDLANVGSETGTGTAIMDGELAILPYHIHVIDDTRLFFSHNDLEYQSSNAKTRMYVWGFDAGHPFEVAHLSSTYISRSSSENNFKWAAIAGDGKTVAYSTGYYGHFWTRPLSTAFDLSTLGSQADPLPSVTNNPRIHLARNGEKFVLKSSSTMYVYDCASAFDYASPTANNNYNMTTYLDAIKTAASISGTGTTTWKDFVFSDDGTIMFASIRVNDVEVVVKMVFSTAWKLDTGTVHSVFKPTIASGGVSALAVNAAGTRLLLHLTGDGKLHEFPISE